MYPFLIHLFSISVSPKGWTAQELGSAWLEHDFEPFTAAQNKTGKPCLLILDGHNSHTTYCFCKFAAKHDIIVFCLPAHCTHALQPCDVGVFGPLASCWKAKVNRASHQYILITKYNLIEHYHQACINAFKESTIQAAFQKTGIWPFDSNAIPVTAFAPALNTTTQAAQPLSVELPAILISLSSASNTISQSTVPVMVSTGSNTTSTSTTPSHILHDMPATAGEGATHSELLDENKALHAILKESCNQLLSNHAQMVLMEGENHWL